MTPQTPTMAEKGKPLLSWRSEHPVLSGVRPVERRSAGLISNK
jgi:hypothetical protein